MSGMSENRFTREQALAIFGVTEDDLEAMERVDGYQAARSDADAKREAFKQYVRERIEEALRPMEA